MNSIENVLGIDDTFEWFTFQVPDKERLTALFKLCPFLCCQIISEHFAANCVTL